MGNVDEKLVKSVMFEILHLERKNLRTKALTDQKMSEGIGESGSITPHMIIC